MKNRIIVIVVLIMLLCVSTALTEQISITNGDVYQSNPLLFRDNTSMGWRLYYQYCIDIFPQKIDDNCKATYLYYYSPGSILLGLYPEFSIYLDLRFKDYSDYCIEKDRVTSKTSVTESFADTSILFFQETEERAQMYLSDDIFDGAEYSFAIIKFSDIANRIEYYASWLHDNHRKESIETLLLEHMINK